MEQKVSFTQEEEVFFRYNNNYFEYFFEVGIKPSIFSDTSITKDLSLEELNSKLYPEIISKFPYFDKNSMTIDSTIIDFIFPKNYKAIQIQPQSNTIPNPEFYSIILDNPFYNSYYSYKYIGCLLIYENLNTYKQLYDYYSQDPNSNTDINKSEDDFINIYVPKCLCLASVYPNITKFESILRAIYDIVLNNKHYFLDIVIEKLICQTPKAPRGFKKVFLKIDGKEIDLTETKLNELMTVNVDLRTIFSSFKIEKIVEIFKLMLYETKMVIFSSKIGEITNFILCFVLLLKPFTYQYRILSILPKKYYFFLEDSNPSIFGVNELYSEDFFQENNLNLTTEVVCVVDLDKKDFYIKNKDTKSFPPIPKHLRDKLDKRTEEYRKAKKKTGDDKNKDYQEIFYRFMINLLKDYPKFLKKCSGDSNKFDNMFDKQGFLNSQSSSDKDFYDRIISSQMFLDLITKRLMPRDINEKIQALFFEEKLNVKIAQKKFIRGNKILDQNVLLPSTDYDYIENPDINDLSENNSYFHLNQETFNFFYRENINQDVSIQRGYTVGLDQSKTGLCFKYYLFPELLSEQLFKYNCNDYTIPSNYNSKISEISERIILNGFIKFDTISKGKSEFLNDIYLSYLILFSLCLSYMDEEERKSRFNNLVQIISKIDRHDMKVIELLFNSLIKQKEEDLAVQLYTMFNQMHINLNWGIFLSMSKILHKGQNNYSSIKREMKCSRGSSIKLSNRFQNVNRLTENKLRKRSIKLPGVDDNILGEEIFFDVNGVCLECNENLNLEKICGELSPSILDQDNGTFKCSRGHFNVQKLYFRIGTELYNKNLTSNNSSLKDGVILLSPTILKMRLFNILSKLNGEQFDVDNFRMKYPEEFWNSIWYFKLKYTDISFILPYTTPVYAYKNANENNIKNSVKFILDIKDAQRESGLIRMFNNEIKNPNTKIVKFKEKKIMFNSQILCIQKVYQIAIFKVIGMITYKPSDSYRGNISIKGNVIKGVYSKKIVQKNVEKKNKPKNNDDILFSNNLIISDFDLASSTSTGFLDKNEEISNKMKEAYSNYENEIINRKTKVIIPNDELFENIREDDENYYKFREYRDDDGDNF